VKGVAISCSILWFEGRETCAVTRGLQMKCENTGTSVMLARSARGLELSEPLKRSDFLKEPGTADGIHDPKLNSGR
jgi:hypothetical protein